MASEGLGAENQLPVFQILPGNYSGHLTITCICITSHVLPSTATALENANWQLDS